MCGEGMWAAAAFTNDPKLRKAADGLLEFILHNALRAPDGLVYHTPEGGIFYSDANNASAPFLAAAGHYDEAMRQLETARQRLWDPKKRLMKHGWSDASQSFNDPHCWGGGNGWTASAYMRVIRCMGAAQAAQRKRLEGYLKELLDGCLAHQRPDGLFHDVVDEPQTCVETDLSAMLAYSIYQSVRGGWLPASYTPAAERMRAAVRAKVDENGFVQGAAGAPDFDHPGISPEAQGFFLLMESAAYAYHAGGPTEVSGSPRRPH